MLVLNNVRSPVATQINTTNRESGGYSQGVKPENYDVAKRIKYKQETTLNIIFNIPRYHIEVSPNWNLAF